MSFNSNGGQAGDRKNGLPSVATNLKAFPGLESGQENPFEKRGYYSSPDDHLLDELDYFDSSPAYNVVQEKIEQESLDTLQEMAEQTTYGTVFLDHLIKRQRALGLSVAITFLIFLFSFPLVNFWLRGAGYLEIFGFQLNWLLLAVLFYPLIWTLAFYFVSTADKYEEEFTKLVE